MSQCPFVNSLAWRSPDSERLFHVVPCCSMFWGGSTCLAAQSACRHLQDRKMWLHGTSWQHSRCPLAGRWLVVRGCPSTTHHSYQFLPQFEMWRSIVLDSFWWCVGKRRVKRYAPVVQTITALHKLHEAIFARKQPRLENQRERQRGSRVVGFLAFFIQTEYMFTSRCASFRCCYLFGGRVFTRAACMLLELSKWLEWHSASHARWGSKLWLLHLTQLGQGLRLMRSCKLWVIMAVGHDV